MAVDETALERAVAAVVDRELDLALGDAGMVHSVDARRHRAEVVLALPVSPWPGEEDLRRRVADAAAVLPGVREVAVGVGLMTDAERDALRLRLRAHMAGEAPATSTGDDGAHGGGHGHGSGERRMPSFLQPGSTTRVVGISSGKGGVGKSSVTVNLAVALARAGQRVGILDADVYGFSVPKMVGADHDPVVLGDMVLPALCHGVRVLSMGFFVPDDTPVIWRGPMLHKAIEQFLGDAYWGDPDVLLVDMPPGTGDVTLSLAQFMTRAEVLVVTTPQPAAQRVAQRSAFAARKLKLSVRGVIENMSWFTGDDGTRYELFGRGGGQALADDLGVPLLGQVPLVPKLREGGDEGVPVALCDPDGEAAAAFDALAAALVAMGPARVYRRELSVR
ncbi:MAG TPA: Mrp/NBP35 family ATP-binding protein [Acidimicrobiales bacterium]|nr:Mrp/NBP35 family ATP-binding protein [Acidimicrobiales bacterium]